MPSHVSLIAALALSGSAPVAAQPQVVDDVPAVTLRAPTPLPPEAGTPTGPSATAGAGAVAGAGAGTIASYDAVGYASWYGDGLEGQPTASGAPFANARITAAHRALPLGSHAEVTSLDTGRTILVRITDRGPAVAGREIDLSTGAARLLGVADRPLAAVRVRSMTPSLADAAALDRGEAASPRLDTPDAVLRALRRQLPAVTPATRPPPPRATPMAAPSPRPGQGLLVQVAAFSSEPRAIEVARSFGGEVEPAGAIWRVRVGPFATLAEAQRTRDAAVARGYGDASILLQPSGAR
ncbi:MAG: septal ring lytic transglycosylase RlpA family protein [Sphingomonas adhaesiva]|uniref:septal ring lytic transglycosylase RlpA family protein n=1 Tax=Sphingomonas adhaesiva TaxID=28212 RepID=UPI002FF9DE30